MQASETRQPKSCNSSKSTDPAPKGQRKAALVAAFALNVPGWECFSSGQLREICSQSSQCSPVASGGARAIHHVFLAAPERQEFWVGPNDPSFARHPNVSKLRERDCGPRCRCRSSTPYSGERSRASRGLPQQDATLEPDLRTTALGLLALSKQETRPSPPC